MQQLLMGVTRSVATFLQHLDEAVEPGIEVHVVWLWINQCLICEGVGIDWSCRVLSYVEGPEDERCVDEHGTGEQDMSIRIARM